MEKLGFSVFLSRILNLSYRGKKEGNYGSHRSGRTVHGIQNARSMRAKLVDAER